MSNEKNEKCPNCGSTFWVSGNGNCRYCIECLMREHEARAPAAAPLGAGEALRDDPGMADLWSFLFQAETDFRNSDDDSPAEEEANERVDACRKSIIAAALSSVPVAPVPQAKPGADILFVPRDWMISYCWNMAEVHRIANEALTAQPNKDQDSSAKRSAEASPQIRGAHPFHDFGFEPGGYMCICVRCKEQHQADKRAWRCFECAAKLYVESLREALETSASESRSAAEGTKEGNTQVTGGAGAGDLEEGCTFNGCGQPAPYDIRGQARCGKHKKEPAAPKRDEA